MKLHTSATMLILVNALFTTQTSFVIGKDGTANSVIRGGISTRRLIPPEGNDVSILPVKDTNDSSGVEDGEIHLDPDAGNDVSILPVEDSNDSSGVEDGEIGSGNDVSILPVEDSNDSSGVEDGEIDLDPDAGNDVSILPVEDSNDWSRVDDREIDLDPDAGNDVSILPVNPKETLEGRTCMFTGIGYRLGVKMITCDGCQKCRRDRDGVANWKRANNCDNGQSGNEDTIRRRDPRCAYEGGSFKMPCDEVKIPGEDNMCKMCNVNGSGEWSKTYMCPKENTRPKKKKCMFKKVEYDACAVIERRSDRCLKCSCNGNGKLGLSKKCSTQ